MCALGSTRATNQIRSKGHTWYAVPMPVEWTPCPIRSPITARRHLVHPLSFAACLVPYLVEGSTHWAGFHGDCRDRYGIHWCDPGRGPILARSAALIGAAGTPGSKRALTARLPNLCD